MLHNFQINNYIDRVLQCIVESDMGKYTFKYKYIFIIIGYMIMDDVEK